jgi:uncharacterized membrane protein HdeD (DUF308 family)
MVDSRTLGDGEVGLVTASLTVVVGILVLVLPDRTLVLVAALLGVQLVLLGVIRAVILTQFVLPRGALVAGVALSVVTVVAGLVCFVRPQGSLTVVALFVGIGWIADGVAGLLSGRSLRASRSMGRVDAALAIAGGVMVVLFPHDSVRLLAQVAGVLLLIIGASRLTTAVAAWRAT